ncbi:MAG: ABC transporter substrate-binding protein [Spirochaetaceae bacterium]|jgi:NitT/TauT family transport system substrate-binding protein|nr:ABC transporter substrate-binding protein [Spirochaetaceae bacterium]
MKTKKSVVSLALVTLITALVVSGCSEKKAAANVSAADAAADSAADSRKSLGTLKVVWVPTAMKHTQNNIAQELGFFEEEGVTVEPVVLQNPNDGFTALKLAKVDVVAVGVTPPLQFISEKSDLTIFGGSAMEGGVIVALPERVEEFRNLENFRGKKYGSTRSYTGEYVIRDRLRKLGIVVDRDFTYVDLGSDNVIIQGVVKGAVDVAYITADGVSIAKDMGLEVVLNVADLDPGYPCCRQNTTAEVIRNKRDLLVAYHRALIRAHKVIYTDRDTTIDIVRKASGQSIAYIESGIYSKTASKLNPAPTRSNLHRFNEYLKQEGIVKEADINLDDHINSDIFAEALEDILERYPGDPTYLELKEFFEVSEKI